MRKHILAVLVLLFVPVIAGADARHRDMLLTGDGTLYSVESEASTDTSGARILQLTVQSGDTSETFAVPATLTGGDHTRPALAYDSDSETLFVFWQKAPTPMATELLFTSYNNGKWSKATSIGGTGAFRYRDNLRVAVTRKYEQIDSETDEASVVSGVTVHAVWWEETGISQLARYAMLAIEKGAVTSVTVRDLADFVAVAPADIKGTADGTSDLLRHPSVRESQNRQDVEVVFGDVTSNRIHRVTLKPVADGRVRIPIGVRDTSHPGPRNRLNATDNAVRVSALTGADESLAFYAEDEDAVRYIVYSSGKWSSERVLALSEKVSAEAAVEALRKMLAAQ